MPANPRSLRLTGLYRERLSVARQRLEREARARWPSIEELDSTTWPAATAVLTAGAQREAIRATQGYLAAFLALELGRRSQPPPLDASAYVGLSRDGRPLAQALESPLIGVRAGLANGLDPTEALRQGLNRAVRMVGVDFDHSHRTALLESIEADERFEGWQRAVRGTCGACAGIATGPSGGLLFEVHPGCECVSEPIVARVRDRFPRPTGAAIFAAKSKPEQDEMLGPEAADQVRAGDIELSDLVTHSRLEEAPDFITQRPVQDVAT